MPVTRLPPVYPLPSEAMEKAPEANWYTSLSSLMYPSSPVMFGSPNITGTACSSGGSWDSGSKFSGALYVTNGELTDSGQEGGQNAAQINFDASRSSSIYSASNTVQPATMLAIACIKV